MTKQDVLNNLNKMVGTTYSSKAEIEIAIIEAFEDFTQGAAESGEVFTSVNDLDIIAYIYSSDSTDSTEFMIHMDEYFKITSVDMWN